MESQTDLEILTKAREEGCELVDKSPADYDAKSYEASVRESLQDSSITTIKALRDALYSNSSQSGRYSTGFECHRASEPMKALVRDHHDDQGYRVVGNCYLRFGDLMVRVVDSYNYWDG